MLAESDLVIAMAGANTVAEILAASIPCILAPRQHPRREQATRALRLEQLNLARTLDTDRNDAPKKLADLVYLAVDNKLLPPVRLRPNCNGARNAARAITASLMPFGASARDDGSWEERHHA